MARLYKDYLNVDSNFIPVFSKHSDRDYPEKWKSFFPHESFKSIMSQMADTLEMSSVEKNKPLWMSGAYGTGKTYASFVIKHILEDDLENIKPYFEANNMMTLYARFSGIRSKGKILVVHRSASAGVIGENRLYNCIRESIKIALKENDCSYMGQKSQYDSVLTTLKDSTSSFNFENAFNKYKSKFTDFASTESVIKTLEEVDLEESIELLETIVEVAEKENYIWSTSTQDVIDWIDDVVKGNNLYAIVFIWDEFTEFFKNNQNNITGLQELAHAASSIKFYLFLITHSNSQIINDLAARKVIEARFKQNPIEMADTTAFKLMSQAIKFNPDLQNEWDKEINDLWQRVERSTRDNIVKHSDDIKESELQSLLPLHPYAAYLLKVISKDISSNQRTMFQFLSGDYYEGDQIKTNFRWFIDNYSNENQCWNYLTANYIWDYFFTNDNVDLDAAFKSVISHYNNYESLCQNDDDKKKVLKVALLLTAMQQKSGASRSRGLSGLLRPTLSNIATCFIGTPLQSRIYNIMADFVSKSIFGKVEENNDTLFVPPLGNIDEDRFNEMKEEITRQIPFEKILSDNTYSIYERFLPTDYLKYRFAVGTITPTDYKGVIDKLSQEKANKIPLIFMFAKNETEQTKVKGVIEKIYNDNSREIVIVDFSSQILTDDLYNKFIHSKTEERYYGNPNQKSQSDLAKRNAKLTIDEWKNKLDMTSLDVYLTCEKSTKIQGGANLRKRLQEINVAVFPCGLEDIAKNDKLFSETGYKETVAQMAMGKIAITNNYSYLTQISTKLANENIWNNNNYYKDNSSHIVSQMKIAVDKIINDGFLKNGMVEIADIWKVLENKPFGLLSCTGSVYILGFLLKEYADSTYFKNDGANTVSLNYSDLSDLIYGIIKDLPKVRNQFIVKQTPEHVEFCKITGSIFKIAADKQNSIGDIAKYIKLFLSSNEYPLWSLKNYIMEEFAGNDAKKQLVEIIEYFCNFISSENFAGRDKTKIAEDIYRIYKTNAGIAETLEDIVKVENMKLGMQFYIGEYNPELIKLTKKLVISAEEYLFELNKKLSSDSSYLWVIGDTNKQIDNIFIEYKLIDSINNIISEKKKTFGSVAEAVNEKLNNIKIPISLLANERQDLDDILKCLYSIKNNSVSNKSETIKTLELKADVFNDFFNNQFKVFNLILKHEINTELEEDEVEYLFGKVESGIIDKQTDVFLQSMSRELEKYRKNKKINKLYKIWQEKTTTTNPSDWCEKNTIPILCLYQNDIILAQKVFELINKTRSANSENDIDEAINYVNSNKLDKLINVEKNNIEFKKYFSGEYEFIIDSIDELKNTIKQSVSGSVYDWVAKKSTIDICVRKLAEKKYVEVYKEKVKTKIKELSPEKAQKLLQDLIEDKPLVGINILKD